MTDEEIDRGEQQDDAAWDEEPSEGQLDEDDADYDPDEDPDTDPPAGAELP
jgi:hypothetical protein